MDVIASLLDGPLVEPTPIDDVALNLLLSAQDLSALLITKTVDDKTRCRICNASFTLVASCRLHMRTHKGPGATFICKVCKVPFSTKQSLTRHFHVHEESRVVETVKVARTNSVKYPPWPQSCIDAQMMKPRCSICSKVFACRDNLSKHMRIHNGVVYKCDTCGSVLQSRTSILSHNKAHSKRKADDEWSGDIRATKRVAK